MKEVKAAMFKRTAKFSLVGPSELQLKIMRSFNQQPEESEEPQNIIEQPTETQKTEIPEELKPLAEKWRENLRLMAQAKFTPAIMAEDKAYYVLQNLPANFDNKTGITTVTVRAIGEDLKIYEVSQKIHMDKYGRVLMLGNEVKPIEKPTDIGITADVVVQIVKGVAEGSNPIPLEFGLK
jgi:Zn-dependent metalloprotease